MLRHHRLARGGRDGRLHALGHPRRLRSPRRHGAGHSPRRHLPLGHVRRHPRLRGVRRHSGGRRRHGRTRHRGRARSLWPRRSSVHPRRNRLLRHPRVCMGARGNLTRTLCLHPRGNRLPRLSLRTHRRTGLRRDGGHARRRRVRLTRPSRHGRHSRSLRTRRGRVYPRRNRLARLQRHALRRPRRHARRNSLSMRGRGLHGRHARSLRTRRSTRRHRSTRHGRWAHTRRNRGALLLRPGHRRHPGGGRIPRGGLLRPRSGRHARRRRAGHHPRRRRRLRTRSWALPHHRSTRGRMKLRRSTRRSQLRRRGGNQLRRSTRRSQLRWRGGSQLRRRSRGPERRRRSAWMRGRARRDLHARHLRGRQPRRRTRDGGMSGGSERRRGGPGRNLRRGGREHGRSRGPLGRPGVRGGTGPRRPLLILGRVTTEVLTGLQPSEQPLPRRGRNRRGRWRRRRHFLLDRGAARPSRPLAPLGREPDVTRRTRDAVAPLLEVEDPHLRRDHRDDAHAGDEAERIRVLRVIRADHRHLQAAALMRQRERAVLLGERRSEQPERLVRRRLEVLQCRHRVAGLLAERLRQFLHVEVIELDQIGAELASVDQLGLQGFVELGLRDEAFPDQDRAELFRHEASDSSQLPSLWRTLFF